MISVRPAAPGDGVALHAMVAALAASHGLTQYLKSSPQDLENALFREGSLIGAELATWNGEPAGCAIWHRSFSTFRGRDVMYLEDLSVLPPFRRRGIARALMQAVARRALAAGQVSVYWVMMTGNAEARALYAGLGAEIDDGVSFCRIHDAALAALAS